MIVEKLTNIEWTEVSKAAHYLSFQEVIEPDYNKIDYALLVTDDEKHTHLGYATCMEFNTDTVYLQHGGTFPGTRGFGLGKDILKIVSDFLLGTYQRILFLIENQNIPMLKSALNCGYRVIGLSHFKNKIFLEHSLTRG